MDDMLNTTDSSEVQKLKRALYYESQYRNAIVANSLSFYDANITKDLIESDFFYQGPDGNLISIPETVGLTVPCKFSELIKRVCDSMIPEVARKKIEVVETLRDVLIETFNSGKRDYVIEYWAEVFSGRKLFLSQSYLLTKNEDGDICALSVLKDYTMYRTEEENKNQKELEQYAYFDPVTNGYNYIKFKEKVVRLGLNGTIISVDIHSFKVINSYCGITKGDQVIKCIWENIVNIIDISENEVAAHINADHFIIFMPTTDYYKIVRTIKNITLALSIVSSDLSVPQINPYFGISSWQPGKRIELAYSEALTAKHNAKDMQSSNYAFFNEEDTLRLIKEKTLTDSFEDALAKREFKIYFQPKINPETERIVGAEALVRWINSEGETIYPGSFIPVFEKNNMIRVLDEYIFRNVCIILKQWENEGINIVPVSVNLSRASLYYQEVVHRYKLITDRIGIDPKYIPIEITESAAITNNQIKEIADEFYDSGFSLHMDDFGSGYSSLASLNTLHFDTLKLDKSLIDYIGNFGGERLIDHTICLAKDLGMHVTAEGVESVSQVNFLKYTGCDSIQGYYYSKPVPQRDFEEMLKKSSSEDYNKERNYIAEHISEFNQSFVRPAIYSFIVNLTKNVYIESTKNKEWADGTQLETYDYQEVIDELTDKYILEEYKEAFHNFMDHDRLIAGFCGTDETRMFTYYRYFNGEPIKVRMITDLFKIPTSDDLMLYITVSKV